MRRLVMLLLLAPACGEDPTGAIITDPDCAGIVHGDSTLDRCGTCDDDPSNDCTRDCNDTWGGAASLDACGTCDTDPANDCVEDCGGVPGGHATLDACGTCDENPLNDCIPEPPRTSRHTP